MKHITTVTAPCRVSHDGRLGAAKGTYFYEVFDGGVELSISATLYGGSSLHSQVLVLVASSYWDEEEGLCRFKKRGELERHGY